jgi:hypothetical protein
MNPRNIDRFISSSASVEYETCAAFAAIGTAIGTALPRPKSHRALTVAPAHTATAFTEWKSGIDGFLEWANMARTGETPNPAAVQVDATLTEFSQGTFDGRYSDLALWAVAAGKNIRALVRAGHWHLVRCRWCDRWLLAKDHRRTTRPSCRRLACVRAAEKQQKAAERQALRDLDRGGLRRARTQRTF